MELLIFFLFNTDLLPMDSIKPKMTGYGLSTFSGIEPDTFDCEIIDIMEDVEPKRNLIIAKLKRQNLENTGIIAGMSGSPVFINGKLIGAIAYAWGFQKEPICGITPIYEMLYPESFPKLKSFPMRKFSLPIALTVNLDENQMKLFNEIFPQNIKPLFLPMGSSREKEKEITPIIGTPCGVSFVDGDLKIAAIGTLTYLNKDTIYAFGHPLFNFGEVELPLVLGKIHCVMPAYDRSFKLFSPIKELGIINYDYQTAIKGLLNKKAKKIPLTTKIYYQKKKEIYHYQIANHYKLLPILLPICHSTSISSFFSKTLLNYTIKNKIRLYFKNKKDFFEDEKFQVSEEKQSWSLFDFYEVLKKILENPFEKVAIESCQIESEVLPYKKALKIREVILNKITFLPNETLKLKITFQDWEGQIFEHQINLKLALNPSKYFLYIGNPDFFQIFPKKEINSFSSLLAEIRKNKRGNILKLVIYSPNKGIILKDYSYSLPLSLKRLKQIKPEEILPFTLHFESDEFFDYFITNSKTLNFEIKDKR